MQNSIIGVVRHLGQEYADGTLRLEIHIPIEKTGHLPIQLGVRIPVSLQVGQLEYAAGLRSTKNNKYAWVCPDIYLPNMERHTLGRVLTDAKFSPNDQVRLVVNGFHIALHRGN